MRSEKTGNHFLPKFDGSGNSISLREERNIRARLSILAGAETIASIADLARGVSPPAFLRRIEGPPNRGAVKLTVKQRLIFRARGCRGRIHGMLLVWVCGKEPLKRLAFVLLAAGFAASAAAQGLPKTQAPAARTIILPQKMVAGDPATLAVLDSAGRLLPNVAVELSGGRNVTTDSTGRASFVAPGEAGRFAAKIPGQAIAAFSSVVTPETSTAEASSGGTTSEGSPGGLQVLSYPHFFAIHDRFTIEGKGFRGVADSNHVFLADQPCLVVASSPVSLVVLPEPRIPIGTTTLRVRVAGHDTGQIPVLAVLLEFSGPTEAPDAGAQGTIILHVYGVTERLDVEVRNESPEIIQLPRGNVQHLTTSGGKQNIAPVELKFLAPGNYTVAARLIRATTGAALQP